MVQLIRKDLVKCYKNSGVNFIDDCKEVSIGKSLLAPLPMVRCASDKSPPSSLQLAHRYLEAIKGTGVSRANEGPHEKATWA